MTKYSNVQKLFSIMNKKGFNMSIAHHDYLSISVYKYQKECEINKNELKKVEVLLEEELDQDYSSTLFSEDYKIIEEIEQEFKKEIKI